MPRFRPIKRRELIHYLRVLGFEGPYSGRKHQFMIKGEIVLRLPNPHQSDISKELLSRIIRQAKIDKKIWEEL
ncbi:type II toxin-antitoxin system HicA family toxin [candidate division KSB1 bacterium]|nr:type II toxin-antitoxin system HicA family toxin [candidate division KSB1 bacterium]